MGSMARFDAADIRRYYDRHSASFVRFGQGRGSIHRAVWGPGTRTRDQAFHYVDDQIAVLVRRFLSPSSTVHVVDLGCGVGASLCHLAEQLPIRATGITLSPVQAAMAREVVADRGLSGRVECFEGDYCDLPATLQPADLAYAIESFVHGPDPARFFDQCRRLVKPGGLLVICDDVRKGTISPHATRAIDEFTKGWHINALLERDTLVRLARDAGFEHQFTLDLTPLLEINRVRDRAIAAGVALLKWLPFTKDPFDHVIGGDALQRCLAHGWIGYELSVFRTRRTR
jgi:cyclopropane fatty-acyl-phospholipid synthase-like methyltransferase